MEDLAKELVSGLLNDGEQWWKSDSEAQLLEVTLTILEVMDPDTASECLTTIAGVMREEYGE